MRYKYHALFDNLIITDETDLIKFRDIYFDNVLQDGSITQQKKDEIESDVDMVIVTKHKIFHITGQWIIIDDEEVHRQKIVVEWSGKHIALWAIEMLMQDENTDVMEAITKAIEVSGKYITTCNQQATVYKADDIF